jgi:superfamily II DNA/RNA helicase
MDLSQVKTVAGDLDQSELDAVMSAEKVLHGIVKPTVELTGGRRTLVFTTSVENAHRMAEVFCRYREGCARAVDGGMELGERRKILADHQSGAFQFLVNCAITTEGYDDPAISCIVMARPTKSRALYTQMAGRGTRLCHGKEDLLLLDFVGNSGRHKLVTAADILAGRHPDDVVSAAKAIIQKNPGARVDQALAEAVAEMERRKKAEEARRAAIQAKVKYATEQVNPFGPSPFDILGVKDPLKEWGNQFGSEPATEPQLGLLAKMKMPIPPGCTKQQATKLIGAVFDRRRRDLCSFGQAKTLQRFGYETKHMAFSQAKRLLDALAANRWQPLPLAVSDSLASREPGEE